ncbi:hypothetical protein FVEN_g6119 [Fusarium venenatum]|uniref:Protamine P1 n=1 Tax=Fusarium venenatum TaxID=56646 RepID=A0A2L2T3Y9_9HYPO|nr:uncharacterized protein FVRRES_01984 [Fusarium venenatum]KAG8355955.1 hypothetical protein FVEN_g6119 [Fusarium venenatum]KAH7004875.1 hypothetical protein EDB82DRAFT_488143 [Fusarium venenatum]CEI65472.1 unnamed protein product [Fusarium venenatum]
MALQCADPLADELALEWGEDTIYCEATCDPSDVFYEGSEDEDYDNPDSRKLRYEAAGQRFLEGKVPLIVTATLKGPFQSNSTNWLNPWRSKHRTAGTSAIIRTSPGKLARSARVKRISSIPETQLPPHDRLECHLPSPESLNRTSETETHPYLEDDELVKVQQWRDTVKSEKGQRDEFWTSATQTSTSERKRKANGSSWLKLLASKRQRKDIMESGSVDTPIRHRPQVLTPTTHTMYKSITSAPDHLPSSSIPAGRFFSHARDEPDVSEDELSRGETTPDDTSADSSSPLSQLQYTPVLDLEASFLSQNTPEQQTPSKTPGTQQRSISGHLVAEPQSALSNKNITGTAFETQEDESFCFKMRPRIGQVPKSTSEQDESKVEDNEDSWSGISSPDQYMDSIASVSELEDSTPVEEHIIPPISKSLADTGSCSTTNPLVSTSSGNFDETEHLQESTDTTTGSSSSTTSSATSDSGLSDESRSNSSTSVAPGPVDEPQRDHGAQDVDMQEAPEDEEDLAIAEHLEASGTEPGEESDEEDEGEHESDGSSKENTPDIKSPSATSNNKTPQISTVEQEAKTTLSETGSLNPHSCNLPSATASLPQQTWTSGGTTTLSSPAPNPVIVQENQIEVNSTHSTPKTTTTERDSNASQPWNHDTSPTIVNTPIHEHTKQQLDQLASKEHVPVPFSQQSPWVQHAMLPLGLSHTKDQGLKQAETNVAVIPTSPEQTAWTDKAADPPVNLFQNTPIAGKRDQVLHESATPMIGAKVNAQTREGCIAATPVMTLTPEPQFSVKSFASFRSLSPERSSRRAKRAVLRKSGSGLPSTQAVLASATKNPWESESSERRVSFAPLPNWRASESSMPATPCPSLIRRQGSPPPDAPTSELPTSEGDKFQKHFKAVSQGPIIRRHQRLLPSESQRTVGSPLPDAMADTFLAADQLRQPVTSTDPTKSDQETEESQDPLDMVADIMLEEFNCVGDTNTMIQSPGLTQGHQSPWY